MDIKKANWFLKDILKKYENQLKTSKCIGDRPTYYSRSTKTLKTKVSQNPELLYDNNVLIGLNYQGSKYLVDKIYNLEFQNNLSLIGEIIKKEQANITNILSTLDVKENKITDSKLNIGKDLGDFETFFIKNCISEIEKKMQKKTTATLYKMDYSFQNDNFTVTITGKNKDDVKFSVFWVDNGIKNVLDYTFNNNTKKISNFNYQIESSLSNIMDLENSYYSFSCDSISNYKMTLDLGKNINNEINSIVSLIKNIDSINDILHLKEDKGIIKFDKQLKKYDLEMIELFCEAQIPKSMSNQKYKLNKKSSK